MWTPGEVLAIDWGSTGSLHVFCAVLAWSRFRFVRFADNERSETTLAMLAECFEELAGVPKVVLADRMGCLKGGVVANKVVPTAEYVRFAAPYWFRPDWCEAADPESKGIVENLVGYAKRDLIVPQAPFTDMTAANAAAGEWCAEVNGVVHSEICAVPAVRLDAERDLLTALPSLRPAIGRAAAVRKVDRLSCVRFGSARYSVPTRLIGRQVAVTESGGRLLVADTATGEVVASHIPAAPGEARVLDEHYGGPRPAPRRAARRGPGPRRRRRSRAGAGRRGVPDRIGGLGQHQAGRRPARDGCPARRARRPGADRGAGTGSGVPPLAGRGRPVDPGCRGRDPAAPPCRGRPGHRAARGPRPAAVGLQDRRRVMTAAAAGAAGGGLLPARPLAAQAHALHAAAVFIEQAGIPGLSLTIDDEQIVIQVPADLAGPASRAAAVARLADAAGGRAARDDRPGRTLGWIRADGQIAGHRVRIFTAITEETP